MAGKRKGPTKMAAKKTVADKEKSDILNSSELSDECVLYLNIVYLLKK